MKKSQQQTLTQLDSLTLEIMCDPEIIEKNQNNFNYFNHDIPGNDIKFYRKRISNLFKEKLVKLSNLKTKNNLSTIDALILKLSKEAIKHFKQEDFNEMQQKQLDVFDVSGLHDIDNIPLSNDVYTESNELLFAKQKEFVPTLDNFIVKTDTLQDNKSVQFPKLNPHNLKDKKFRYKGVNLKST